MKSKEELTKHFLENMDEYFPNYNLFTLDVRTKGNVPKYCVNLETAKKINDQLNHDVYFTPNGHFKKSMYQNEK
jgi:tRNA U34 5-carboxymethylaminomethyl modifying enzyme MnmG/GidA